MLNTIVHGDPDAGPALLIAHGLFGSARNWGAIAKRLSRERPVVAVDMRNHGASPWRESHGYPDLAEDLAEVIEAFGGQMDVLGHSMGGKAAMALALTSADRVRRLIVADIAPVAYDHTQTPLIEAMESVDLRAVRSRKEADQALEEHVSETAVRAFLAQSLDLKGEHPRWVLNLPVLKMEMAGIIGFPEVTGSFDGPSLFLTGDASDYVMDSHHAEIRTLFPQANFEAIPGAGHWLHAEAPGPFIEAVSRFLQE